MPRMRIATLAMFALLTGCGDAGGDGGTVGALSADDMKQLNEAAEMLDVGNHPPLPANSLAQ